jgi:hypothetical protein
MGVKLKPFRSKTVYELLVGWGAKKEKWAKEMMKRPRRLERQ